MKKRTIFGGVLGLLAGIGVYGWVRMRGSEQNGGVGLEENWTTADIPDLTGKVIIVTGANSGLGFESTKELTRKGARVVMACRNMDKARSALHQILLEIPNAPAEIVHLDLADLDSVREFVAEFKAKHQRLDVLVNNAGIMVVPYGTTKDGFESQLGTNHLGHFALTGLLLGVLLETPGSRVVTVSSSAHRFGRLDFDNLMSNGGHGYSRMRAYGRSKLANLLFTYELERRLEARDASTIAVAAHPGTANTNLSRHVDGGLSSKIRGLWRPVLAQSATMGALPILRAATDPGVQGGEYYGPNGLLQQKGYPVRVDSNKASHSREDARRLWQASEQLTGVRFAQLDEAVVHLDDSIGSLPAAS
jgi:NAD(P)-dependent dehydrogenase (short-subunit alcohol dehydrogenase family)